MANHCKNVITITSPDLETSRKLNEEFSFLLDENIDAFEAIKEKYPTEYTHWFDIAHIKIGFENNSIYKFIILEIDLDTEIKEIFLKPGEYNFEMHKSNKKMGVIKFDLKQNDKLVIYKKNNDLEYNERDDDTNFNYKVEKIDFGF